MSLVAWSSDSDLGSSSTARTFTRRRRSVSWLTRRRSSPRRAVTTDRLPASISNKLIVSTRDWTSKIQKYTFSNFNFHIFPKLYKKWEMSRDFCRIDLSIVDKSVKRFLKYFWLRTPGSMMGRSHMGIHHWTGGGGFIIALGGAVGSLKHWKIVKWKKFHTFVEHERNSMKKRQNVFEKVRDRG